MILILRTKKDSSKCLHGVIVEYAWMMDGECSKVIDRLILLVPLLHLPVNSANNSL